MSDGLGVSGKSRAFTIEEFKASDGYTCRYRRYVPAGAPKAHLVCIHGIQSHGGWYEYSCTRLSREGFAVSFLDRRGSGLNEQARGDTPSFRRLLDDLAEFILSLSKAQAANETRRLSEGGSVAASPGRQLAASPPVILVAISWGGKLALALQRRYPGIVNGLVLLCPGFFPRVRPSFRQRLAITGARVVSPLKLFPIPLNDPELFTATPHWQKFILEDPLSLRQATARLLVESARLDGYLRFAASYVRKPVLVLLAEQDRIIDNGQTRQFVDRFPATDKKIIEYPGAHHTLEFEPDPNRFINDIQRWLEERV